MGGAQLARRLIEHDLVDEYRVVVEPIVRRRRKRLFPDDSSPRPLGLVSATRPTIGVYICHYRSARETAEKP